MKAEATPESEVLSELDISSNLDDEFKKQSSYYANWGFKAVRAADRVRRLEEKKELVFGSLYAEYREQHDDAKENDCKAYIRMHNDYKAISEKLLRATRTADILKIAVKAFEMRRDMLVQLGAQYRAEHDATDLSMKTKVKRASKVVKSLVEGRK